MQGQPMIVLGEDSQRTSGKDAQSMNITAAQAVAEAVRTTLGPKGMDKMLVDDSGGVVVTNDGVTILDEMDIEHPAANMIVEVAQTQEDEVGDGTTTAVVISGELLSEAEDLIDQDIHASILAQGYRQAAEKAKEILEEQAIEVGPEDTEMLKKVAATAMTGKGAESSKDVLAELVVRAAQSVADDGEVDTDNIQLEVVVGGSTDESELVEGVIIDKERVHDNMPYAVEDANIALLDTAIEVPETELDTEVNVTDPDQLQQFLDQEEEQLKEMVDDLKAAGADVVVTQKGIDDMAQHYLAQEGILAVRRAKKSTIKALSRSTGARIVSNIADVTEDDLGFAGSVAQKDVAGDERIFVEDVDEAKSVTMILRGGTEHVADEVERAIEDSLGVVAATLEDGKVLPGGGAPETQLALGLRDHADSVGGREQLAVEAFADAIDVVPRTLAENAGLDPIDSLVDLRSKHDGGDNTAGLDAYTGEVVDMTEDGVVEPLRVKTQAIESATEAAVMILRIDDVIAAGDLKGGGSDDDEDDAPGGPGGAPGGMGGGMGGMGGGMGGMM
ncbi:MULTISPECIES: thermosome subunit alpha [Halomicrobium]|uniref:Thermosome n=2 Tax=Halomicrobium mukohataei TaxID=57705 RepID=C7NZS2_HALMD|nr:MULTISPECIES: thermosome subunit alpha [Halomicrobium]ACV46830.1 thermosome [Halomicrobium mukohataei DSM 12286]QCD67094.1 thermosome subunit [Halomicrobium mukohataei]QFR21903.1 thermosome subunit [Halomicrobium sp. ZPS1]